MSQTSSPPQWARAQARGGSWRRVGAWPAHTSEAPTEGQHEPRAPLGAALAAEVQGRQATPSGGPRKARPGARAAHTPSPAHATNMLGDHKAGARGSRWPFSQSPKTTGQVMGEDFTSPPGSQGARQPLPPAALPLRPREVRPPQAWPLSVDWGPLVLQPPLQNPTLCGT